MRQPPGFEQAAQGVFGGFLAEELGVGARRRCRGGLYRTNYGTRPSTV